MEMSEIEKMKEAVAVDVAAFFAKTFSAASLAEDMIDDGSPVLPGAVLVCDQRDGFWLVASYDSNGYWYVFVDGQVYYFSLGEIRERARGMLEIVAVSLKRKETKDETQLVWHQIEEAGR